MDNPINSPIATASRKLARALLEVMTVAPHIRDSMDSYSQAKMDNLAKSLEEYGRAVNARSSL